MFHITCFADEISPDFNEQIRVVKNAGIHYVELRSAWDINILDLDDCKLNKMKRTLDENEIKVSCLGSPIGKYYIEDVFEQHLEKFKHGLDVANFFGCDFIRVFSFYSRDSDISQFGDEVIRRLRIMLKMSEQQGVRMVHENEEGIFGHRSQQCLELAKALDSKFFGLVLDPANYCLAGEKPFDESYQVLQKYVQYIHVKDFSRELGRMVEVGKGDGQFAKLLPALSGKDIYLSLEPHLDVAGQFRGFSGEKKFLEDYECLKELILENGMEFD